MGLGKQIIPLIPQAIQYHAETIAEEKKALAFNTRISKLQASSGQKTSLPKLTTGVLGNESVEDLGRRKWSEYEQFLDSLPNNATPNQVKDAMKKIDANIRVFPCDECKTNAVKNLKDFPLDDSSVSTKQDAKKRLCGFHNITRNMLGKPITVSCESL